MTKVSLTTFDSWLREMYPLTDEVKGWVAHSREERRWTLETTLC